MKKRSNFLIVNTAIFASVAVMHLIRLVYGAPIMLGSIELTMWPSAVAVVFIGGMALLNWRSAVEHVKNPTLKLVLALLCLDVFAGFYSWFEGLEYWGFSNMQFGVAVVVELLVIAGLYAYIRRK